MRIAYVIRAHHRPRQLARLVSRLRTPNASFFVHVSATTSDETFGAMRAALGDGPDVRWVPRVRTHYGGFSLVEATLVGVDAAARTDPDVTVLLSGQDYPLRPADEIERFFAERPGVSFVHHFALPAADHWPGERGGLDRIERYYLERVSYKTRLLRLPLVRRRLPAGLRPYGGSAWWALQLDAIRYLDRYAKENPRVLDFFRHVKMPDEIFVQTVLMSSPLHGSVRNEQVHLVDWSGGAHPAVFTSADAGRLLGSDKLFARKFDVNVDADILDLIDREALGVPSGSIA